MKRARVLVLRDKQASVLKQVEKILAFCISDDDESDYSDAERDCVISAIKEAFDVTLTRDDTQESMEKYGLSALIAKILLDRDPPDTTPAWSAPWA